VSTSQLSLFAPSPAARSFHHRRPIPGSADEAAQEIAKGERKAREQEATILAFYRANPGAWSPSQVWQRVGPRWPGTVLDKDGEMVRMGPKVETSPMWPLTSVRRAISNLTDKQELRITMERIMGHYGRPEHLWTLSETNE